MNLWRAATLWGGNPLEEIQARVLFFYLFIRRKRKRPYSAWIILIFFILLILLYFANNNNKFKLNNLAKLHTHNQPGQKSLNTQNTDDFLFLYRKRNFLKEKKTNGVTLSASESIQITNIVGSPLFTIKRMIPIQIDTRGKSGTFLLFYFLKSMSVRMSGPIRTIDWYTQNAWNLNITESFRFSGWSCCREIELGGNFKILPSRGSMGSLITWEEAGAGQMRKSNARE